MLLLMQTADTSEVCFIEVGTNDLRSAIAKHTADSVIVRKVVSDYAKLLELCTHRFAKIYVIEILPTAKFYLDGSAAIYLGVNSELKKLSRMYSKATFISVHDILAGDDNYLQPAYTQDGLHLNTQGYEVFSKKLFTYLY